MKRRRVRRASGPAVWVVSHCEVYLQPRSFLIDETVVYVATSMDSVEEYLSAISIQPGTWWRVEQGRLDDIGGVVTGSILYSRRGKVIKTPPVRQGYLAAVADKTKWAGRYQEMLRNARRVGRPRKEITSLERNLRGIRRSLQGHPLKRFDVRSGPS